MDTLAMERLAIISETRDKDARWLRGFVHDRFAAYFAGAQVHYHHYHENARLFANGLASMGIALPGSIAAALVEPGRQVVAAMAESFGIRGCRPETVAALEMQLEEAVTSDELALVGIPVDPGVNNELVDQLEAHWAHSASKR